MLRHRTTVLALALLASLVGCGGGSKTSSRSQAIGGVNSGTNGTIGLVASATPLASNQALMTNDVTALALQVTASGVAVELQGVTVHASGTIDESTAIGSVRLVGDDDKNGRYTAGEPVLATVAAPAFTANDGSVALTLATPIGLSAGASLNLLVVVDATAIGQTAVSRIGQTIALRVDAATSLPATSNGAAHTASGPFPLAASVTLGMNDHLLITEIVGDPTNAEFIEIFNPTGGAVDLSTVYVTDADDLNTLKTVEYYFLPTGRNYGPSNLAADMLVRFPAGATLAPGACLTMATDGVGFLATYGKPANYCARNPAGGSIQMLTSVPDSGVWTATAISGSTSPFYPYGEPVVLFTWDGQSDLVRDLDTVYTGTKATSGANDPHDKTGVSVDGPDAGTTPSVYLTDKPAAQQANVTGTIVQRIDLTEGSETQTGGNGVTGNDEFSENTNVTFVTATTATPGTP
jgi:hypothetical protein